VPRLRLPFFDAHLPVIDPRFPLVANDGYLPPAQNLADLLAEVGQLSPGLLRLGLLLPPGEALVDAL